MQALWNELTILCDKLFTEASRTGLKFPWDEFNRHAADLAKSSSLNWETGPEVLDRFRAACHAAARNKQGRPQPRKRLDHLSIPHRFTRGGVAVEKLFSARAKRFRLERTEGWAYEGKTRKHSNARITNGIFGLGAGDAIHFKTVLHRELPRDGIVKRVMWVGRRHPTRGWQWALVVIVEEPAHQVKSPSSLACAVDFGWRMMGAYIRIGMICDQRGRCLELRLPLDAPTSHTRRHKMPSGYHDLIEYASRIGYLLEVTKSRLAELAPKELEPSLTGLSEVKQGGLIRVLQELRQRNTALAAREQLERWLVENDRLRSIRLALSERLTRRRQWLYQNLATWLCRSYGFIVWEDDLNLKRLAERKEMAPALRAAGVYRKWAAIGELRVYIAQAAEKHGASIIPADEAFSTVRCALCGQSAANPRGALILACPNGHSWDQDVNAARNLLSQSNQEKRPARRSGVRTLDIPSILQKVIIQVLPE